MAFLNEMDKLGFFYVHRLQKFNLDPVLAWPTVFGSLTFALCAVFFISILLKKKEFFPHFLYGILPLLITFYITKFLKAYFAVPRPSLRYTVPPDVVTLIMDRPSNFSFPSGHASMAFALAAVLAFHFKINRALVFSLAALVCLTRLYVGVHYPTDVIVGGALGLAVTVLFLKFFKFPSKVRKNS